MKILYVDPIVASQRSANYKYYDGVYEELSKSHQIRVHRGPLYDLDQFRLETGFEPEAVLFGLGWFGHHKYFGPIRNLDVPAVCWLFKSQNDLDSKLEFCRTNDIDLILTPVPNCDEYERTAGVRTVLFPYGFDPDVFCDTRAQRRYDIGFSGALHETRHYNPGAFRVENLRPKIGKILSQVEDLSIYWNSSDKAGPRIASYVDYAATLNSSKMWLATQAAFGDITPRYYEVAACGALLICQKIPAAYQNIFQDGHNCVEFADDLSNFEEKVRFYAHNEPERNRIAHTAATEFRQNHTWAHRTEELVRLVGELRK